MTRADSFKKIKSYIKQFYDEVSRGIFFEDLDIDDYVVCLYDDNGITLYEYQGGKYFVVLGLTEREEAIIKEYYDNL